MICRGLVPRLLVFFEWAASGPSSIRALGIYLDNALLFLFTHSAKKSHDHRGFDVSCYVYGKVISLDVCCDSCAPGLFRDYVCGGILPRWHHLSNLCSCMCMMKFSYLCILDLVLHLGGDSAIESRGMRCICLLIELLRLRF